MPHQAAAQPAVQPPQPPVQPVVQPPQPPVPPVQSPKPPVQQPVQPPVQRAVEPDNTPRTFVTPTPAGYAATVKPANALLCLRTGPMAGRNFQCPPGRSVIAGRDPSRCNLPLAQSPTVSGVHCRMDIGDHVVTVTDLGSSNGTYIRGARLRPNQSMVVTPGESVILASENCVFQIYFE